MITIFFWKYYGYTNEDILKVRLTGVDVNDPNHKIIQEGFFASGTFS
jgi:hypothetical protein